MIVISFKNETDIVINIQGLFPFSFRIVYEMAKRRVFYTEVVTRLVNSCCPGWDKYDKHEQDCLKRKCNFCFLDADRTLLIRWPRV